MRVLFLRGLYRNASPATEAGRSALLDAIDDAAITQIGAGGRRLTSTSSTNSAASFDYLVGFDLASLAILSDWARSNISEADAADAIAAVPYGITSFSTNVTHLRCGGVF